MSNLDIWNKIKRPPETALKSIQAGRLKGMTDISPQWRYYALTEQFGPCGIGWKYEIKEHFTMPASYEQVMVFIIVDLYVKIDGEWSEPIPGMGGNALVAKEKNGLYSNDEAYKMALTDALSTAAKMLGVAADIYMGQWDGSKYKEEPKKLSKDEYEKYESLIKNAQSKDEVKDVISIIREVCSNINDLDSYKKLKDIAIKHAETLAEDVPQ